MYFAALATDYDGTLAQDGCVDDETLAALHALRESGRKLILVTGRELPDLRRVFSAVDIFDLIVAENGALLFDPKTCEETVLGAEPPKAFIERLKELGVAPMSLGRSIVATWQPHQTAVLETIRELGLELQIIFNKDAVMVLPAGVNKATGLAAALDRLKLSPLNVVAVGDAENDHSFLHACGCAVAVANALPMVKEDADLVMGGARGAGVGELISRLIGNDLADIMDRIAFQRVSLARDLDGTEIGLHPHSGSILVAGPSGGGKSTFATGVLERLADKRFQFCIIDPEGDYAGLDGAVTVGDSKSPPRLPEAMGLLWQPAQNVVINLIGVALADRPRFFAELIPELSKLRSQTSRPHWLVIDEAHHLLPPGLGTAAVTLPRELNSSILITVHPEHIATSALESVDTVIALGGEASGVIRSCCEQLGDPLPELPEAACEPGEALLWPAGAPEARRVRMIPPQALRQRHSRKYAEGELEPDKSFYFRGPDGVLNLRAQNLALFLQLAEGVDDGTWVHHLRSRDYSHWVRGSLNDNDLADELTAIENDETLDPRDSRTNVADAIKRRYTAPA